MSTFSWSSKPAGKSAFFPNNTPEERQIIWEWQQAHPGQQVWQSPTGKGGGNLQQILDEGKANGTPTKFTFPGANQGGGSGAKNGGAVSTLQDLGKTWFGGNASGGHSTQEASQEELDLRDSILGDLRNMSSQDDELTNLIRKQMVAYLSNNANGTVDPAAIKEATNFVDQTFTNQAQTGFDQFQRQYEARSAEQAAQMGRSPLDSAIQQQNFRALADVNANMQAQRGSKIAERANNHPMESLNFISDLNNRAFTNRMKLLDAQSSLLTSQYTNPRQQNYTTSGYTNPGLLGLGAGAVDVGKSIFGGLKGLGGSGGNYRFGNNGQGADATMDSGETTGGYGETSSWDNPGGSEE